MLYVEGRHKPKYRGVLHSITAFPIPIIGFAILFTKCKDVLSLFCATTTSLCIFTCLVTSTLWHRGNWNREAETFIRTLDRACILLVALGTYLPLSFYALPKSIGYYFALYVCVTTVCGFTWIIKGGHEFYPHLITCSSLLTIITYITDYSIALHSSIILFIYFIGFIVFLTKKPALCPNVFGYHELFHVFVVISMVYTYYLHYRLIC
jgi:hemolysin III